MKSHDAGLDRIKELLREHPKGMKVTQIAAAMGMNRNSVAKYLDILLMTHQVEMLPHGMSKIYRLSRRTGIPTVLDASPDLIIMLDSSLRIVQVNDNYLAFAGVTREAVSGIPSSSPGLPGVNLPAVLGRIPEAQRGETARSEVRVIRKGIEFCFSVRIAPSLLPDGKSGVILVFEDITDKKKNEDLLKASEADFRTLFSASTVGMAVCDTGGGLLEANAAFLDIFRVTTQNEIDFLNIFAIPGIPAGFREVMKNGKSVMFESILDFDQLKARHRYFPRRSGRATLEVTLAPISLAKKGWQAGYLAQVRESDSRVQEPVPDESQKLLEEILACIDEAVVLLDSCTGTLAFVNPVARQVYGYQKGEAYGKAQGVPGHSREMEEAFAGAGYLEIESQVRGVDGRNRRVTRHLRPVYNNKGELRHIVIIIRETAGTDSSPQGFSLPLRTFSPSDRNTSGGF